MDCTYKHGKLPIGNDTLDYQITESILQYLTNYMQ